MVELIRDDNAAWALHFYLRKAAADAFCAELNRTVALDAPGAPVAAELRSTRVFEVAHDEHRTRITWRGRYTLGRVGPASDQDSLYVCGPSEAERLAVIERGQFELAEDFAALRDEL